MVLRQPSPIRAVTFERDDAAFRLRQRHAQGDRAGEPHAAEHVEILRPMTGGVQIEIGIADAADHRLVVLELLHEELGQRGTI